MNKEISLDHSFKFACNAFINNFFLLFGCGLLIGFTFVIAAIISIPLLLTVVGYPIFVGAIYYWLALGFWRICFDIHDSGQSNLNRVLSVPFGRALVAGVSACLSLVAIGAGYLLFIIPGIILTIGWMFMAPAILLENKGIISALSYSWQLTRGARLQLCILYVIFWVIGSLPIIYLFAYPISILVLTDVYRQLQSQEIQKDIATA